MLHKTNVSCDVDLENLLFLGSDPLRKLSSERLAAFVVWLRSSLARWGMLA